MQFSLDWQMRVDGWLKALEQRVLTPLVELPTEMAQTAEQLRPEELAGLKFKPVKAGTAWGKSFEYAWFRATAKLPAGAETNHPVLTGRPGNESVVLIDGLAAGAFNPWHKHVELPTLKRGAKAEILIEAYAGNPVSYECPFVVPGAKSVPAPGQNEKTFGGLFISDFNNLAFGLLMDAATLRSLGKCVQADSLRQHRIQQALMEVSVLVDVEAERAVFDKQAAAGRKLLAELLAAKNGPTMPEMHCFGHAHIDLAWLWPMRQSFRKAGATFATALALMKQYKGYKFLQSQAQIYEWVRRDYPEIFEGIRAAVRRGQWIADGGMWVECDTNVAGGESLIRQFAYGRRYFKDTFGVDSLTCWLPDVFGYTAALPQIMAGCGLKYFTTHKIYWNYHGGTTFPYETFTWEGLGGQAVLAHLHRDYNARTQPEAITDRWGQCVQKDEVDKFLYPYGYGDGGGGPTIEHLEYLARQADLEGTPRTRQSTLTEFFTGLEKQGPPEARYVGELYYEGHRGVYTSQAWTKRLNRKCELALREAELWGALAWLGGQDYPAESLEANWKNLLLNQFHDILPGSSIQMVYEEAEELFQSVLAEADALAAGARATQPAEGSFTLWNSLSWPRSAVVALPAGNAKGARDSAGNALPVQADGSGKNRRLLVAVGDIPAMGCTSLTLTDDASPAATSVAGVTATAKAGGVQVENEFYKLTIDRNGQISRLLDKESGRELVDPARPANCLQVFRDNPATYDAWDLDASYRLAPVASPAGNVKLIAAGPLEARIQVIRPLSDKSKLEQTIVVRAASRRVDFDTRVSWYEKHRVLKVAFPARLAVGTLRGEVQFGHVVRPTHQNTEFERQRFEWPAQKWVSLAEPQVGLAVLNDCKYGHDFLDGCLRLTLLRAPVSPDEFADQREHEFVYSLLVHGPFEQGQAVRAAYELNVPVTVTPGLLRQGLAGPPFALSNPNVIVETVKRSDDGRGLIVRLYESLGAPAQATLRLAGKFDSAWACNLIEEPQAKLPIKQRSVELTFGPFEIKTVLVVGHR